MTSKKPVRATPPIFQCASPKTCKVVKVWTYNREFLTRGIQLLRLLRNTWTEKCNHCSRMTPYDIVCTTQLTCPYHVATMFQRHHVDCIGNLSGLKTMTMSRTTIIGRARLPLPHHLGPAILASDWHTRVRWVRSPLATTQCWALVLPNGWHRLHNFHHNDYDVQGQVDSLKIFECLRVGL